MVKSVSLLKILALFLFFLGPILLYGLYPNGLFMIFYSVLFGGSR